MLAKGYRGTEVKQKVWGAATAYDIHRHMQFMEELKGIHREAYDYLSRIEPHTWARAFFPIVSKTELVVNNMSENFNARILHIRDKPIITMMEMIKRAFMREF